MLNRLSALTLLAFLSGAHLAPARAEPATLETYSWLVGVWVASGSSPETGEFTEEYAYEWTLGRKFMKTTYVMRSGDRIVWTDVGMVGLDPATGHLFGINFGMDGTIGWGRTIEEESAESFLMEGNVVGQDVKMDYRARMKRIGEDGLEFTIENKVGDAYLPQSTQTYRRKATPEMTPCPEPDAAATPDALAALGVFVGVWRGSGRASGDRAVSIEISFEWRLNRTFVRRVVVVTDPSGAARETVEWIGWNPDVKEIVSFAFDAEGTATRAIATFSDGRLVVEADGAARTTHRLDTEGGLVVSIEEGARDNPVETLEARLARK